MRAGNESGMSLSFAFHVRKMYGRIVVSECGVKAVMTVNIIIDHIDAGLEKAGIAETRSLTAAKQEKSQLWC